MTGIVLDVVTENDSQAERTLAERGYTKHEVWVRDGVDDKQAEEEALRRLGVARFAVTDCWGRCPD